MGVETAGAARTATPMRARPDIRLSIRAAGDLAWIVLQTRTSTSWILFRMEYSYLTIHYLVRIGLSAHVRFTPDSDGRADIPLRQLRAKARNRCALAHCAGSLTVGAVTRGKIVKTQNRCALIRPLRRCGVSGNIVGADRTVSHCAPHIRNAASAAATI